MIYVFIADGSEEVESVAPIDFLRREKFDVRIVKVGGGGLQAVGSRGIKIVADIHESEIDADGLHGLDMIVLPGGAGGVEDLYKSEIVKRIIEHCVENNINIGAICAAPSVLARRGFLKNVRSTAFPSFAHYLTGGGAAAVDEPVVTDGIFTTARDVFASVDFALELAKILKNTEKY